MTFPANGEQLMAMRQRGKRPSTEVFVTLDWWPDYSPLVVVRSTQPIASLDLRFLHDLDVYILCRDESFDRVWSLINTIADVAPKKLVVVNTQAQNGVTMVENGDHVFYPWNAMEKKHWGIYAHH